MEDHQVKEISAGLKAVAGALGSVAFAIWLGAMYIGCMVLMHH